MKRVIKYFQSPAFTAADWSARNPYLNAGEVGYLLEGSPLSATKAKVGPGYWNDLDFIGQDQYLFTDPVTNPIGDVTVVPTGDTIAEVIRKMISPYIAPVVSALVNNLGGTYNSINYREIGESFSSPVNILFNVSNPENLLGPTPVIVSASPYFVGGSFVFVTPISLSVASPPLNPNTPVTITIGITLNHINGTTSVVNTQIVFSPRIMWASSLSSTISDGTIFVGQSKTISSNYQNDYHFPGGGYSWLAIPSMLSSAGLVFTDVTNPELPLAYSMDSMGTIININNGVGTYNYELYRSTFNLIGPSTLRVR